MNAANIKKKGEIFLRFCSGLKLHCIDVQIIDLITFSSPFFGNIRVGPTVKSASEGIVQSHSVWIMTYYKSHNNVDRMSRKNRHTLAYSSAGMPPGQLYISLNIFTI